MIDDNPNPFAIIIAKDYIVAPDEVEMFLERHGPVFCNAHHVWKGGRFEFIALICNSPERLQHKQPRVFYCESARELLQVIEQSTEEVAVPVEWKCCVNRESAAHLLLTKVLPAERTTYLRLEPRVYRPRYIIEREAEEAKRMRKVKAKRNAKLKAVKAKKKAAKNAKESKPKKPLHPWLRGL